jgi:hypothetical protein
MTRSQPVAACAVALRALLVGPAAPAQPPLVEESPGQTVVRNAYYQATILRERGGFISQIALDDGSVVVGEHALYTDRGIYGDGVTVTSAYEAQPEVRVTRDRQQVAVTSSGTLRGTGDPATPERRLDYTITYTFDESPAVRASWSVVPDFSLADVSGFFSYIMHVPQFAEWSAKTIDGVIFQPASGIGARSYQSAVEPLDLAEPWLGLLRDDGGILAFSDLDGQPAFGNVFLHEGASGGTAVFFAWFSGPATADFAPGSAWSGQFRMHIWPRVGRGIVGVPEFLW